MMLDPVTGAAAGGWWSGRVITAAVLALALATGAAFTRALATAGAGECGDTVIELQEVDLRDLDEDESYLDDEGDCSCDDDLDLEDLADPPLDDEDEIDDEILLRR